MANLTRSWNRVTATQMFYVADGDSTLLSYETALDLKILSEVNSVKEVHDIRDMNLKDTCHGTGTYKGGGVKLHIDEPTEQLHPRIPFHKRKKLKIKRVTSLPTA